MSVVISPQVYPIVCRKVGKISWHSPPKSIHMGLLLKALFSRQYDYKTLFHIAYIQKNSLEIYLGRFLTSDKVLSRLIESSHNGFLD